MRFIAKTAAYCFAKMLQAPLLCTPTLHRFRDGSPHRIVFRDINELAQTSSAITLSTGAVTGPPSVFPRAVLLRLSCWEVVFPFFRFAKMRNWKTVSLFVCVFAFVRELRPIEPFYANYMTSPAINVTLTQVDKTYRISRQLFVYTCYTYKLVGKTEKNLQPPEMPVTHTSYAKTCWPTFKTVARNPYKRIDFWI